MVGTPSITFFAHTIITAHDTVNMGSQENKSEILGLDDNSEENKDKEGELVALDYDIDTSKGERALKVIIECCQYDS